MKYDPQKNHRKSYRLPGHGYAGSAAYFVTIVTADRACLFGDVVAQEMSFSPLGRIANEFFLSIPEHFMNAEVDVHQIMPNHVHGIIVLFDQALENHPSIVRATQWVAPTPRTGLRGPKRGSIGAIIGAYKMAVTRRAMQELDLSNVWQRNYYDRIIRDDNEWQKIRDYISANPAHWHADEENSGRKTIHKL